MPTYEYSCTKCGTTFEVRQSFSDSPVTKCVTCNGKVKKVFSPPAIIFKGKGFHCTDYKKGAASASKSSPCATCPKESGESTSCPATDSGEKCAAS